MIPVPYVMKAFGCNRNKLNKWRNEGHLAGSIPDGTPGVPSMVSREVALEIAFMSVLTGAGYNPSDAKVVARNWLDKHKQKTFHPIWIYDPIAGMFADSGDGKQAIKTALAQPREQVDMPLGAQNRHSLALRVFNLAEIIARLDEIEREHNQIESM